MGGFAYSFVSVIALRLVLRSSVSTKSYMKATNCLPLRDLIATTDKII